MVKTILLERPVYDELVALARWQKSTPKFLSFPEEMSDEISTRLEELLGGLALDDEHSIFDVETSRGALWAVVLDDQGGESRVRLRRK